MFNASVAVSRSDNNKNGRVQNINTTGNNSSQSKTSRITQPGQTVSTNSTSSSTLVGTKYHPAPRVVSTGSTNPRVQTTVLANNDHHPLVIEFEQEHPR